MKIINLTPVKTSTKLCNVGVGAVFTVPNEVWGGYVFMRIWNASSKKVKLVRLDGPPGNDKNDAKAGQTWEITEDSKHYNEYITLFDPEVTLGEAA